jgi:hypothetical protein
MKINLKGCYTILGNSCISKEQEKYEFEVSFQEKPSVKIIVNSNDYSIEAYQEVEVSGELYKILESKVYDCGKLSPKIQKQISTMEEGIIFATKKTLNAMKFFFNWEDFSESLFSIRDTYWSKDQIEWNLVPVVIKAVVQIKNSINLTENTSKYIQGYLDGQGWEPLLALRHLQKAKIESNPRYKWIDATIAAELAIKEFYIRLAPQLETLLLEVPSPPLTKLYGSVMESLVKVKSPKLKEISKGVEIRNKLVHRPDEINIDANEANKYVEDIEQAIFHLLSILYTNEDPIIKHILNPRIVLMRA